MELNRDPTPRQLLWFGILLGPFVALLGFLVSRSWGTTAGQAVWAAGGALTIVYLAVRRLRRPIFVGWTTAVYPIGWTVSHLVLGLVYFALFLPIGLALRLSGHDPLQRRSGPRPSYWVARRSGKPVERYFRQF